MFNCEMLVMASAASAEISARRADSLGSRLQDAQRSGMDHTFGDAHSFNFQTLARQRERYKDRTPFRMAKGLAAIYEFLWGKFKRHGSSFNRTRQNRTIRSRNQLRCFTYK